MDKIKWYYKIGLLFAFMFAISYTFLPFESGIPERLIAVLLLTLMFSPIAFIDWASKASTEKGKEKLEKYTLKQRILIDLLAIVIVAVFILLLFWFTS